MMRHWKKKGAMLVLVLAVLALVFPLCLPVSAASAGSTWSSMTSGTTNVLWDVWGSSSCDVFAVGQYGTILHYDGSAWSSMTSGTTNALGGVWGSSPSDVFAVGASGTILRYGQPAPPPAEGGLSGAAIAGIIVGAIAGAGLIFFAVREWVWKR